MSQNQTRKIVKRTISSLYLLNCPKHFLIYFGTKYLKKIRQEKF